MRSNLCHLTGLGLLWILCLALPSRLTADLLIVSDATHGSNVFTDSSGANHPVTAVGMVDHTTGVDFPTGSGSSSIGFYNSGSDYLTVPDSNDWSFGTSNFTIDLWMRLPNATAHTLQMAQGTDLNNRWYVNVYGQSPMFMMFSGGTNPVQLNTTTDLLSGTWYHYAVVRSGDTFTHYLNGTSQGSVTWAGSMPDFSGPLSIGTDTLLGGGTHFVGNMDQIRITGGTALWTADFVPPIGLVPEPTSLALLAGALAVLANRRRCRGRR
jgi:hypothetical protein